jgi:hypothetical protein
MDNGWSRKQLIRTIVTSATYRQSSDARKDLQTIDPGNELLARQQRLRLPAELIRDNALYVSGLLSLKIGGPSVRPPQPKGVIELGYQANSAKWIESTGPERYRRGLYVQFLRTTPYPQLMNFDAPKGNAPACTRERSNTSLQALNLLNDPVYLEAARAFAVKILTTAPSNDFSGRLKFAYETALGRTPTTREQERFQAYWKRQREILDREPDSAKQIAMLELPGLSQMDLAAWTGIGSAILNIDEFINRE